MNYIDREIKETIDNELNSIKMSGELKNRIILARAAELEKIKETDGLPKRVFKFLSKVWNYEIEVNASYALAVVLIVVLIPVGLVTKEAKSLESQKITVMEGRIETIRQVDGR